MLLLHPWADSQSRWPRAVVLKGLTDHSPKNVLDLFVGRWTCWVRGPGLGPGTAWFSCPRDSGPQD